MKRECIVCETIEEAKEMHTDGAEWYCQYCWEEYRDELMKEVC